MERSCPKHSAALFSILLLFFTPLSLFAQEFSDALTSFNEERISLNRTGMYILSGWALSNITVGSIGYLNSSEKTKYFHQMNIGWNIVNLAIAGGARYQYSNADPSSFSLLQSLDEAHKIENILLLNMGLNVGYLATGGYLWERGLRKSNNRLIGYGQSLILQGSFLLFFDTTLYFLNRAHNQKLNTILEQVSIQGSQLSVSIPL